MSNGRGKSDAAEAVEGRRQAKGYAVAVPRHISSLQRIDDHGHSRSVLEDQLRVAGNARRKFCRQRNRLVEGIGVERLRAAKGG